jgi:hypothetical protein
MPRKLPPEFYCKPQMSRLVGPVVVEHEVDIEVPLHAPVDAVEEADELFRTVPGMTLADDKARLHVERGEQRCVLGPSSPRGPSSRAVAAGCDPAPEFGSFRRRTAPALDPTGSCRARPRRSLFLRTAGRSISSTGVPGAASAQIRCTLMSLIPVTSPSTGRSSASRGRHLAHCLGQQFALHRGRQRLLIGGRVMSRSSPWTPPCT